MKKSKKSYNCRMLNKVEKPKTLKESALAHLRLAIMLGEIAPGQRLVERTIGEQLGVSRTVVRECIRHLESEHLVTTIAGSGPVVTVLQSADILQIYQLRALLECEAVRRYTPLATAASIATLQSDVDNIRAALQAKEIVTALNSTRWFYEHIFITGGMSVAWELVERLNGRIGRLRVMTLATTGRETAGPNNLQAIIDSIAVGDADAAAQSCQKHIDEACRIGLMINENRENNG